MSDQDETRDTEFDPGRSVHGHPEAVSERKVGEFTIESGVPLPEARTKYPWPQMELGDSVVVPKSASSSARGFVEKHRPGWAVTETSLDDPADHIRLWFKAADEDDASEGVEAAEGERPA